MIRISAEVREELNRRKYVHSLSAHFDVWTTNCSFQPVAESSSLTEMIKEAESRGYVPSIFNETAYSCNYRFTSGHLKCVKEGEEYPAVITSEWITPPNREALPAGALPIMNLLEKKLKEQNLPKGEFVYRLYVVQPNDQAS